MHVLHKKASRVLSTKWSAGQAKRRVSLSVSQGQVQVSPAVTQDAQALRDWQELGYAAFAAQHTSLCYLDWENLEATLKAKKLQLIGRGGTYFTRWYVADGCIDVSQLVANPSASSTKWAQQLDSNNISALLESLAIPPPKMQRFIHLRGVAWSSADTDSRRVWQQLGKIWPRPFVPELTHPPGILVTHDGVASMADELYPQLEHFIESSPYPVAFVGHSLGGALAKLLMLHARLKINRPPESLSCLTFGSPPVLAHRHGGGGDKVLRLLGLDKTQCRNFVHENDPVPRAMLTVDPAYRMLTGLGPVKNVLALRKRLLGQGSPLSLDRFLYENVGEVVLLRSGAQGGLSVSLLEKLDEVELSLRQILTAPVQAMQLWLDHHYISYSQELEVAAQLALRNTARESGIKL